MPNGKPNILVRAEDPTIAEVLKPHGYVTGQFGKNHLGDKNEFLPTAHGFDEFYGNLYHLNAEEEPESANWPSVEDFPGFNEFQAPRGHPLLGGLLDHLDELGIADDTIVVYSTDNGPT